MAADHTYGLAHQNMHWRSVWLGVGFKNSGTIRYHRRFKMRIARCGVSIATLIVTRVLFVSAVSAASDSIPVWAYGTDPAAAAPSGNTQADKSLKQLPGTDLKFTEAQIQDPFGPADWFPGDHAVMPNIGRMAGSLLSGPVPCAITRGLRMQV
jgi:hypothetical protein